MAEKLRYAILNCRSIDMDNYMLTRNTDNAMEIEEDEPALWFAKPAQSFSLALLPLISGPVCSGATRFWIIFFLVLLPQNISYDLLITDLLFF